MICRQALCWSNMNAIAHSADTLSIMRELVPREWRVHVHCFTSSLGMARSLLDEWPNLFIGYTGVRPFRIVTRLISIVLENSALMMGTLLSAPRSLPLAVLNWRALLITCPWNDSCWRLTDLTWHPRPFGEYPRFQSEVSMDAPLSFKQNRAEAKYATLAMYPSQRRRWLKSRARTLWRCSRPHARTRQLCMACDQFALHRQQASAFVRCSSAMSENSRKRRIH